MAEKEGDFAYFFSLELSLDTEREAENIILAVRPDLSSKHSKRSVSRISLKKNILCINISALDLVALRASLNSLLKKIFLSKDVLEVL